MEGFPKIKGSFLSGPFNKDYSIFGSTLGSPYLGNYNIAPIYPLYDKGPGFKVDYIPIIL